MMIMLGITMASNLAWAFGVGLCMNWIITRGWISI